MPLCPTYAFICSIDLHWSRLDEERDHKSKDGIASRILKVLLDTESKFDIVTNTLATICEFYKQNSFVKQDLISGGLFCAIVLQINNAIENQSWKLSSKLFKCSLELLKVDDEDSTSCHSSLKGLLNAGFLKTILRAQKCCKQDTHVSKYIGFLLRYFAERGIVIEGSHGHESEFLEDVSIFLLRREASVTTVFNYSRVIALMHNSRKKMKDYIQPGLHTTLQLIETCSDSRRSAESYRILCTLLLFHTWEPHCPSFHAELSGEKKNIPAQLTTSEFMRMVECISNRLVDVVDSAAMSLLMCTAIRAALRPFAPSAAYTPFSQGLQQHLLLFTSLPDTLVRIVQLHCENYRVVVAAFECLFCLTSPPRHCTEPSNYHIISPYTARPGEVIITLDSSANSMPSVSDERCEDIICTWWSYALRARGNARWRRRKSFCIFLVSCLKTSCVYKGSMLMNGEDFPPLALIYGQIWPIASQKKACEKVFFSKNLCAEIASFV